MSDRKLDLTIKTLILARRMIEQEKDWWPGKGHQVNDRKCAFMAIAAAAAEISDHYFKNNMSTPAIDRFVQVNELRVKVGVDPEHYILTGPVRAIICFNDDSTHGEVIGAFDKAISAF